MANVNQLKTDLNRLQDLAREGRTLAPVEPRGARVATAGRGTFTPPATTGTGGIASPLTETSASTRQYYDAQVIHSTDGLIEFEVKPLKQLSMRDANNAEVVFVFAEPEATP